VELGQLVTQLGEGHRQASLRLRGRTARDDEGGVQGAVQPGFDGRELCLDCVDAAMMRAESWDCSRCSAEMWEHVAVLAEISDGVVSGVDFHLQGRFGLGYA
jgi:hypothetical protein